MPGLPHGAACLSRVYGDFDGDGQRDTLYVFGLSKRVGGPMLNLPNDWRARLVLGSGGVRNLRLSSSAVGPLGALAAVDANRDGRSDALILLNRGASDDFIGIVTLTHGRLGLLSGPDGRPFEFDYGGSVMQGGGGGCRIGRGLPEIFQSSYFFARRDHRWHWQVRRYRWQGATVVLYGRSTGTTAPPQTQRYTDFRCFGFSLPPGGSVTLRYWR